MLANDAGRLASARLRRVIWFLRAYLVQTKLCALRDAVERKYDPNQPRVPAGNPDGGQWTRVGGGTGGRLPRHLVAEFVGDDDRPSERIRLAQNRPPGHVSDVTPRPRNLPREIQSLEDIPQERPSSTQVANAIIRFVAYELSDYLRRQGEQPMTASAMRTRFFRRLLIGFHIAAWIRDEGLPAIESFYDEPKTLQELQDAAVLGSLPGYQVHHIVERNSKQRGEDDRINASENLVLVPVFKHYLITGWYMSENKTYGKRSLRKGLKDQDWETRYQEGIAALIQFGVLKP